jgi:hypothetical protein
MTKDDLLSDFIACAEIVAQQPEPSDEVGRAWHGLCVKAVGMNAGKPSIAADIPSPCWCCDMWDFLWPAQREAFESENHILWQAVNEQ